jgi:hypothetical protein
MFREGFFRHSRGYDTPRSLITLLRPPRDEFVDSPKVSACIACNAPPMVLVAIVQQFADMAQAPTRAREYFIQSRQSRIDSQVL